MALAEFTRDFINLSERKFRLHIEEDDMDGIFVELNGFANKDAEDPEIEILYCTIYDGADEVDGIFEEFEDCIQWIESGSYEVSNLIELIREHYISAENCVSINDGWRGPGDTDGEDFDKHCRWTEEDDFKGYDETLTASEYDVVDTLNKNISDKVLDFIKAAYSGESVKEPLKEALKSLCGAQDIEIPTKAFKMGLQGAEEVWKLSNQIGKPFEVIKFSDMMIGEHDFRNEVIKYLIKSLKVAGIQPCNPFIHNKQVCWNSEKRCKHCYIKQKADISYEQE